MPTIDIQTKEARANLSEILHQVFYTRSQYRIKKRNKDMARLVPEPIMVAFERLLKEDNALADTLEIMLDDKLRTEIGASLQEIKTGQTRPADEFFAEL